MIGFFSRGRSCDSRHYCAEMGHEYLVGEKTCVVCGHEWSCAEDGHYTPDLLTVPDCLVCGTRIALEVGEDISPYVITPGDFRR